jgi:hypothetical protein
MPSSLVISSGSTSGSFAFVTGTNVTSTTPVTITASYGASAANLGLTVNPAASATPPLTGLTIAPASVAGGAGATGSVTLQGPAPSGGASVQLSSSNTAAATVPPTVTVTAGATSASFPITSRAVTTDTSVVISALLQLSAEAMLTVTPGGGGTPPPAPSAPALVAPSSGATVTLPVTLDWSDVTAAASYQVQVDDSSTFSSPLVVDQSTTASQLTVSSLAARQHWWRVRGINSAGTAGAWSSVRSFTPDSGTPPPPPPPAQSATLTVKATGRSGERVTSSPSGINVAVGSTGSASFTTGTSITLTVSNGRDAIWSGACSSGGSKRRSCTFTFTQAATVTAQVQ